MSSSVSECTMPATGERPPFFTFVAVRAMAPVAGMPPKNGTTRLAMPWPISSALARWRPPIMPSATIALSSDSMAPSSAIDSAGENRAPICEKSKRGSEGLGRPVGTSPKRLPMVSTCRLKTCTTMVVSRSAISGPGSRREMRDHCCVMSTEPRQIAAAVMFVCGRLLI
jgi:hypothetical protein